MGIGAFVAVVEESMEIDPDEEVATSLCIDCSRHSSVKKMVAVDCTKGRCALCARDNVDVRNPENLEPLVMLIRALIRFHYDDRILVRVFREKKVCVVVF